MMKMSKMVGTWPAARIVTNPAIIANAEDALVTSDFHFDGCPRKWVGGERLDGVVVDIPRLLSTVSRWRRAPRGKESLTASTSSLPPEPPLPPIRVLGLPPFALGEEFPPLVFRVSIGETFPRLALCLSAGGISTSLLTTQVQCERRLARLTSAPSSSTAILARRLLLVARGSGQRSRKT